MVSCAQSGLSQRDYCQQAGIGFSTLQRWARHFRLSHDVLVNGASKIQLQDHFMPITMAAANVGSVVPRLEVRLLGGHVLSFEGPWPWTEVWSGVALLLK